MPWSDPGSTTVYSGFVFGRSTGQYGRFREVFAGCLATIITVYPIYGTILKGSKRTFIYLKFNIAVTMSNNVLFHSVKLIIKCHFDSFQSLLNRGTLCSNVHAGKPCTFPPIHMANI
jgi:hypothetical protein